MVGSFSIDMTNTLASGLADAAIILVHPRSSEAVGVDRRHGGGLRFVVPMVVPTAIANLPWNSGLFGDLLWSTGNTLVSIVARSLLIYAIALTVYVHWAL